MVKKSVGVERVFNDSRFTLDHFDLFSKEKVQADAQAIILRINISVFLFLGGN